MSNILKRVGKKLSCPNCSHTLRYSWLSHINKDWISLYSKAGDTVLVSNELAKFAVDENELLKGISAYEKQHGIDPTHEFSLRNEMRCPNCNHPLTTRSIEEFKNLIEGRVVFLEGMTFINDEKEYQVEIDVS
jgi:DNA-directed RNA polymerase subunit RPC12/RpoP